MARNKQRLRSPPPPSPEPIQSKARWFIPLLPLGAGGFFWWGIDQIFSEAPPLWGPLSIWISFVLTLFVCAFLVGVERRGWLFGLIALLVGALVWPIVNMREPNANAARGALAVKLSTPFFLHDPGFDIQNLTDRPLVYEVEEFTYAIEGQVKATVADARSTVLLAKNTLTISPPTDIDVRAYEGKSPVSVFLYFAFRYGFQDEGMTRYYISQRVCKVPRGPTALPVDCNIRKQDRDFEILPTKDR